MLEFLKVQHPDQIKKLLQSFDPVKQTWIVSDLKSKREIQNESISRFGYYTDDSILQVSDFWQIWLRRLEPTLHIVSSDFIRTLVQIFIDQYGQTLEISENEVSTLDKSVQELAPLLLHPESDSLLKEWMQVQDEEKKWVKWYLRARTCIRFIVDEKRVIDKKWSAAYLQTIDVEPIKWDRELIIDLGTELTSIEMGLFKHLSQNKKVSVYVPSPEWQNKFPFLLKTYTENLGYGQVLTLPGSVPQNCDSKFIRLSTQLAEVKYAVATARNWIEKLGVKPTDIAVMAPDIEEYWPVLEHYLSEEGIPFQKDVVAPLNSLGDVQTFLSNLKNLTQDVSWDSLENNYFQAGKVPEMKYEQFKALFYEIFDEEDLKRDERIKALYYKKVDLTSELTRDDFLSLIVRVWSSLPESKTVNSLFEVLFKDILSQSLNIPMKFNRWYQFLKSRISRKELKVNPANGDGIIVIPLMWSQMISADHRIYLGMYEEAFRKVRKSVLPLKDIEALKNQFDLALDYPDESHLDFNLRWQSTSNCQKRIYTTPHLSFSAEPLTASLYFLENNPASEIILPPLTRSDELQNQLWALNAREVESSQTLEYADRVSGARILKDIYGEKVQINSEIFKTVSAGDIESYAKCSFKLLAAKGFRLRDLPHATIDLDPRQKGTLAHSLFEFTLELVKTDQFDLTRVAEFLDAKRIETDLFKNEDLFWDIQKNKLIHLSKKFHEFEIQHKLAFTSQTELELLVYYDLNARKFTALKPAEGIAVKGRIDRADKFSNGNYYIIYDYKSSAAHNHNYTKWLSEYEFQLLIYVLAFEAAYAGDIPVRGALYYLYKSFDLSKGYVDTEIGMNHFKLSKNNKSLVSPEEQAALKEEFIQFISEIFLRLNQGWFQALPFKTEICEDCDWRKLCRAPHLN